MDRKRITVTDWSERKRVRPTPTPAEIDEFARTHKIERAEAGFILGRHGDDAEACVRAAERYRAKTPLKRN